MFAYIVILVILVGCFLQFDCNSISFKNNKVAQQWFVIVEILLISFAALSYRVGCDTNRYYDTFFYFPTFDNFRVSNLWDTRYEPLWVLLNVIFRSLSNSFYPIYALGIIIINIQIFRFIKKYCKMPFLAVLLYYSIMYLNLNFEMIRQDYAMIFYFWGLSALLRNHPYEFALKALPAMFFHKSALLIYLITIIVYNLEVKKIYCWILVGVFIGSSAIKTLLPQVALVLDLSMIDPAEGINGYLSGVADSESINFIGLVTSFCAGLLIPIIIIYNYPDDGSLVLKKILFAYLIIMSLKEISPIIYRLTVYFQIFYFILICNFLVQFIKKHRKSISFYLVCGIIIVLLCSHYRNFINNIDFDARKYGKNYSGDIRYVPYVSILENTPDQLRINVFSVASNE